MMTVIAIAALVLLGMYCAGLALLLAAANKRIDQLEEEESDLQIRTETLERLVNNYDVPDLDKYDSLRADGKKYAFSEYWHNSGSDGSRNH